MVQLYDYLTHAKEKQAIPSVTAYNRIDGPGSSLDLRDFQQTFWKLPNMTLMDDPSCKWSFELPRTVGITIDTGTKIEAFPYDPEMICVKSTEYNKEVSGRLGEIIPIKDNWLLKILEIFNLQGVKLVLTNLREGIHSSGLGGSSTATIGVCILANELADRPFNQLQLVSIASRIEQDMGVSITGTQEQSNVMFGGVTDYVWFPWGIPGQQNSGYGGSLRFELMKEENYPHLQDRIAIFHSGHPRDSSNVNTLWEEALKTRKGYGLHSKKLAVAYKFREGLRLENWIQVQESIEEYRSIRADLCADYMNGSTDIWHEAEDHNSVVFPLGAGGGGAVFIFSHDIDSLADLKDDIRGNFTEIPSKIRSKGHEILNL